MAIDRLSTSDAVSDGDQIPIFRTSAGQDRRVSGSALKGFVREGLTLDGGILAVSGLYSMRKSSPATVAVGTAYANLSNYDANALVFPAERNSIIGMTALGEFVASRDIAGVMFWVALAGTWPTARDLTLAVLVGPDAAPFESSFQFVGAGRGASLVTAAISGPAVNLNNPEGVIKAGEKIRLVAKMNVADNLNITKLAFVVQTLDGI